MYSKKALIILFFATIILMSIATFLLPKSYFSELENRTLAEAPSPTLNNLMDKSFMSDAETFMADHMIFRDQFAKSKTAIELLTGKREIGGVYISDQRLMENLKQPDAGITEQNLQAINSFAKKYAGKLESTIMLVPTAEEFYPDSLPLFAQAIDQTEYVKNCYDSLIHVSGVDAYTPLSAASDGYIFYRTDHHWTSYGAYLGYSALAKNLGYKAISIDQFNIEHVSHEFLGTLYSKVLCKEDLIDSIDLYTYAQGNPVTEVIRYTGKNTQTYSSVFFRENLEKKDKYTVFLGPNCPVVKVKTNLNNGKKLVVFKDSYANSMAQFLSLHYEEISFVDLRRLNQPLSDYVDLNEYQQALFLFNVGNFTDNTTLNKLKQY